MTAKSIERLAYLGTAVLGAAIVLAIFLSPLSALWTAGLIFAIALLADLVAAAVVSHHRRHNPRGRAHPSREVCSGDAE